MNSEKLKGHILILITNILFAVNMPISKYLLPAHVPPEGLTIMRMAFACVMFWIVSLFTVKEKVPLKDLVPEGIKVKYVRLGGTQNLARVGKD